MGFKMHGLLTHEQQDKCLIRVNGSDIKPLPLTQDCSINAIGGKVCYATRIGTITILIQLSDSTTIASLKEVLYVPDLQHSLFSTTKVAKQSVL
jgi:hypothetical protein